MNIVFFIHSLISDWNHGNAHFIRGVISELIGRGNNVKVFEPCNSWSLENLIKEHGLEPVRAFYRAYPELRSTRYDSEKIDFDQVLDGADLVIAHEWNDKSIISGLNRHRALNTGYKLLFHDTHHRSVTAEREMASYDLSNFDGVLAFGEIIRSIYLKKGWAQRVWTWHEAADTRRFHPVESPCEGDVIWIGNWGDSERTAELQEFLFEPVKELCLKCCIHGVRYPAEQVKLLSESAITYQGWLPNYRVPEKFSSFKFTVHIPRRPYVSVLKGIPTIRVFEALACGIPLICSPWDDVEGLFTEGKDYKMVRNGKEMRQAMKLFSGDKDAAQSFAKHGLETIRERHTCSHRVDQLYEICKETGVQSSAQSREER
jgi:spore maturation protein CgeB